MEVVSMNNNHTVYIQSLYELVELKKRVNPFELIDTAKSIYTNVKAIGINNTSVRYTTSCGPETKKGSELSFEMRAVAAFVVKHYYRWNDDNLGRLETHYGLPTTIDNILADKEIFKAKHSTLSLSCISIQDFIDDYLK